MPESRHAVSRLCLAQKRHVGVNADIWLLDALTIFPVLPSSSNKYLQFSLNLQCGINAPNNRYNLSSQQRLIKPLVIKLTRFI